MSRWNWRKAAHVIGLVAVFSACSATPIPLTARPSPSAERPQERVLHAGAARVDITPPPNYSLLGWGPDGPAASGHRQRLHARALVLRDRDGELLAIATVDLDMAPVLLHHEVARRIHPETGIGPDRLLLAATHTHSGPGGYLGHPAYDEFGAAGSGFDPGLLEFLARRTAQAVRTAYDSMKPATAAWGHESIWNVTRIRSFAAYRSNGADARETLGFGASAPPGLRPDFAGVDPSWWMLRVDTGVAPNTKSLAAVSIFAIHGTAIPASNDLYDADIHGFLSRELELRLDRGHSRLDPGFYHLVLNGAQGDASPAYDGRTRCAPPIPVRVRAAGPTLRDAGVVWRTDPADRIRNEQCVGLAVSELRRLGRAIIQQVEQLHADVGTRLSDTLTIGRSFRTITISRDDVLCRPRAGVAQPVGAEDGRSRLIHWPLLFLKREPPDSLITAGRSAAHCQGRKRILLWPLQGLIARGHHLPNSIQLMVVRLGSHWIATVPGEPTTHSGWTIRRALLNELPSSLPNEILVVGVANGYNSYITTPAEYARQTYEGASTIFGPRTLPVITDTLQQMVRSMFERGGRSVQPALIDPVWSWVMNERAIAEFPQCGESGSTARGTGLGWKWTGDSLIITWSGPPPAYNYTCLPGRWFAIMRADTVLAVDGDLDIETRAVEDERSGSWSYRARWHPDSPPSARDVTVAFLGPVSPGERDMPTVERPHPCRRWVSLFGAARPAC